MLFFFFSWKVWTFFLCLLENICCGYSLEVPQQGTSNEYPQHIFSRRNKKKLPESPSCLELCLIFVCYMCQLMTNCLLAYANWAYILSLIGAQMDFFSFLFFFFFFLKSKKCCKLLRSLLQIRCFYNQKVLIFFLISPWNCCDTH